MNALILEEDASAKERIPSLIKEEKEEKVEQGEEYKWKRRQKNSFTANKDRLLKLPSEFHLVAWINGAFSLNHLFFRWINEINNRLIKMQARVTKEESE